MPRASEKLLGARRRGGVGPELGEHNAQVFEDLLGLTTDKLNTLRQNGVI